MNNIKESLLKVFKSARLQCARGNCADCKYGELHCCDDHLIIDLILDNFVVAEKLRYEDVGEIKEELNSMPKSISDVIFVEDGSVDTDELKKQFGDNVPIIVYRQGGVRPEIRHLEAPIIVTDKPKSDNTDSAISSYKHESSNKEYNFLKKIIKDCTLTTVNTDDVNTSMNSDEEQIALYTRVVITPEERHIINSLKGRLEVESK